MTRVDLRANSDPRRTLMKTWVTVVHHHQWHLLVDSMGKDQVLSVITKEDYMGVNNIKK